jgi:hypothetical protein
LGDAIVAKGSVDSKWSAGGRARRRSQATSSSAPSIISTAQGVWLLCAAAGLTCGALNWFLLRRAIWMAPDSWTFWQGSVSLLDGRGYRSILNDEPIKEWPPLYSLYLAAWQALFGVSGKVLIAAQGALAGLSALGWTRLSLALTERAHLSETRARIARGAQAVFITAFIAIRYDCIRADNLKYALLPPFLVICEQAWLSDTRAQLLRRSAALGAVGMLLMLTHNSSVAFVGAAAVIGLLGKRHPPGTRLVAAALGASLGLIPWLVARSLLEQRGSHRIGFGVAAYHPHSYAVQLIGGSATLLITQPWLAAPLAAVLAGVTWYSADRRAFVDRAWTAIRVRLLFVALSMVMLFALFNLTFIMDKLTGRFIFFVPLSVVPLCIALLASASRAALCYATTALVVLALVPRLLDVSRGVEASRAGQSALPEQILLASDCVRRLDARPAWVCSARSKPRLPPPNPDRTQFVSTGP